MINTNSTIQQHKTLTDLGFDDMKAFHITNATAKIRANTPEPKPARKNRPSNQIPKSKHPLTYWDEQSLKWKVYVKYKGKKHYCGKTSDESKAPAMATAKWNELAMNDAAKDKIREKQREAVEALVANKETTGDLGT